MMGKRIFGLVLMAALLVTVLDAPRCAGASLPDNAVLHVRTGPLKTALGQIEAFLGQATRDTGVPMMIQPGMLSMMLMTMTRLPAGTLDMEAGIEFVGCSDGSGAILVSMPELAEKRAALEQAGLLKAGAEAITMLQTPFAGALQLAEVGDGRIAFAPNSEHARHIAKIAKDCPRPKVGKSTILVATMDVDKLLKQQKDGVKQMKKAMAGWIAQGQENPNLPALAKNLQKLTPDLFDDLQLVLEQVASLRVYLYADAACVRVSTYLTPKPETTLFAYGKAYAKTDPAYDLSRLLPKKVGMVQCMQLPAESIACVEEPLLRVAKKVMLPLDEKFGPPCADAFGELLAGSAGVGVVALYEQPKGGEANLAYYRLDDIGAYRAALKKSLETVQPVMNGVMAQLKVPMPADLLMKFEENAGTVAGVKYDRFSTVLAPVKKEVDGAGDQAEHMAFMMERLKKELAKNTRYLAYVDDIMVMVGGAEPEALLQEAITVLREKKERLGTDKRFLNRLERIKEKQIALIDIHPIQLILAMGAKQGPQAAAMARELFGDLPVVKDPLTISAGVKESKDGRVGFRLRCEVPSQTVQVVTKGAMAAWMSIGPGMQQGDVIVEPGDLGEDEEPPVTGEPGSDVF